MSEAKSPFDEGTFEYIKKRLKTSPHLMIPAFLAWLKGWWYRVKFFVQFKKFSAGKFFRVYGTLHISGPGRVKFGDNCLIISNAIKPVCIRSLMPDAVVELGDHAGLNGTSIQCAANVKIGAMSNLADVYITDTRAHSVGVHRRSESVEDLPPRPVNIGENVWISVQVVILDGVSIGNNSVIGACSLVRKSVPANVFAAGNPLTVIRSLDD